MIASIRLNKQTKTIRVVNRPNNLRLQHTRGADVRLQHNSGKPGPKGDRGDKGDTGDQGSQGIWGGNTVGYYFTSDYSPEGIYDGSIRFNEGLYYHTDYSYVTEMYMSRKDFTYLDVSDWIESLDDSTDPVKGHIRIFSLAQSSNFVVFKLFGLEEHETYYTLFVEPVYVGIANFSGAALGISFSRTGDKGETGISTFVRVHHDTNPDIARPSALYVEWVGSVAPLRATEEDTWVKTPIVV